MENKTAEEQDWTVPDKDDIIHIPDRLDKLFNRLGTQLRFHTISDKNEVLTIAHMTKIADDHASLQCAEMKKRIEELEAALRYIVKLLGPLKVDQEQPENIAYHTALNALTLVK